MLNNLFKKFSKSGELENPIYNSYFHIQRYLSFWVSIPIYYLPIKPNQITVLSNIFQLVGIILISLLSDYEKLYGVFLYFFGGILDFVDGNIARAKNLESKKGIFIDQIGHVFMAPLFFISIALSSYFNTENIIYLYLSITLSFFVTLNSFLIEKKGSIINLLNNNKTNKNISKELSFFKITIKKILSSFYHYKLEILTICIIFDQLEFLTIVSVIYFILRFFIELYLDLEMFNNID